MIIFIESFEFKFENEKNFDCCFRIFHLRLRWIFNIRFVNENVFVTTIISISKSFCEKIIDSLQQSFSKLNSCFKFDTFKSSFTLKFENFVLKRNKIVYWNFMITICFVSIFFDNMTSRRQLNTFYRRFNSKIFKRLILIVSFDILSW